MEEIMSANHGVYKISIFRDEEKSSTVHGTITELASSAIPIYIAKEYIWHDVRTISQIDLTSSIKLDEIEKLYTLAAAQQNGIADSVEGKPPGKTITVFDVPGASCKGLMISTLIQ